MRPWVRSMAKNMASRIGYFAVTIILTLCFNFHNAFATPVLGEEIYYEGGSVEVTVLPYEAGFTSTLYLFLAGSHSLIASNVEVGKVVNLGNLASLGFAVGDELV